MRNHPISNSSVLRPLCLLLVLVALTACGGGGAGDDVGDAGPAGDGSNDVNGRLVNTSGQAVVGTWILLDGTVTTTDDAGRFAFANVARPYTISVVSASAVTTYVGVTRSDPTLETTVGSTGDYQSATIDGTLTGGTGFPQPAGYQAFVWGAPELAIGGGMVTVDAMGNFQMTAGWGGPTTNPMRLHALQFAADPNTNLPTSFHSYGDLLWEIVDGSNVVAPIGLQPVSTGAISGTVSLSGGFNLAEARLYVRGASRRYIATDSNPSTSFSYVTPVAQGLTVDLEITAHNVARSVTFRLRHQPPNTAGLSLAIPQMGQLQSPPDATPGVDHGTVFAVSPSPSSVYEFSFERSGNSAMAPKYTIYSATPLVTIPDLSPFGPALPSNENYVWFVSALGPFDTVDELMGPGGVSNVAGVVSDAYLGFRDFTTP